VTTYIYIYIYIYITFLLFLLLFYDRATRILVDHKRRFGENVYIKYIYVFKYGKLIS